MGRNYDHLSREELITLLSARDRRDATKFGLVWEANEIERDKALNGTVFREGREESEEDWCEIVGRSYRTDEPLLEHSQIKYLRKTPKTCVHQPRKY